MDRTQGREAAREVKLCTRRKIEGGITGRSVLWRLRRRCRSRCPITHVGWSRGRKRRTLPDENVEGPGWIEGGISGRSVPRRTELGAGVGEVELGDDDTRVGMEEAAMGGGDGPSVLRGLGVEMSRSAEFGKNA